MTTEKIIEKIQKLLNTANDRGATENEAMIAALKAQELMAKYSISMTDIETQDENDEIVEAQFETGTGNKWKYILAHVVADNFCCKLFMYGKTTVVFYGFKKNADIARDVFKFLFNTGNRLATRYYFQYRNAGRNTVGVKNAFLSGFTSGVKSVLEKQCTALMLVVPKEVNTSYNNMCEQMQKTGRMHSFNSSYRRARDEEARSAGYDAGRNTANARYLEGGE